MSHFRTVCKHGESVSQCRCNAPNKEVRLAACLPSHSEWAEAEHPTLYGGAIGGAAIPKLDKSSEEE